MIGRENKEKGKDRKREYRVWKGQEERIKNRERIGRENKE